MANFFEMNRLFLLLFGAVSLVSHAQIPDYVPTEGLVAWYPFNGNANDESGNGNDGYGSELNPENFATDRFGDSNSALSLSPGQFVECPNWFVSASNQTEWTMAIWVRDNGESSEITELIMGHRAHFKDKLIQLEVDSVLHGNDRISPPLNIGVNVVIDTSDSDWKLLTLTSSIVYMQLFIDGELVDVTERNGQLSDWSNNYYGTFIGGNGHDPGWSNTFLGDVDDAGVWNRALTEEEILALYNVEPPVPGCNDSTACNYNAEATSDDGSCIPSGCMDLEACNYNALAECEGEACDYSCCPGPGCCAEGMHWDWELEQCQNTLPGDTNGDGCVQLNDLLDVLSAYGNCGQVFSCGGGVSYQGYDYATVLIGEQCWFAENLRSENYENGDAIPAGLNDSEWSSTTSGATAVYGESASNLETYGRLFNWYAVDDSRGLCPSGWHVPTDGEWTQLTDFLGGWAYAGTPMKASSEDSPGWNGTNQSGFTGLPGGLRYDVGYFDVAGGSGVWWSSSPSGSDAWFRSLGSSSTSVVRDDVNQRFGFSVRCVRDAE